MAIIDAHQHVWDLKRVAYPWLTPQFGVLYRTYRFAELEPDLHGCGVDGTVMVQSADSVEETRWMQAVADRSPLVKAIVGWVPLDRPDKAEALLENYADDRRIVGVRHLIHTESDEDWLLRPEVQDGLALLAEHGLTFDIVAVTQRHLMHVPRLSERHPNLRMVINHLAKPPIADGGWNPWADNLRVAAENPLVHAKISGLNTAADPIHWTAVDLKPYVDFALEVFGPDRLMYGGDWPVTLLAGGYRKVWEATRSLMAHLPQRDQDAVFGETAIRFYGIDLEREGDL
ncbi:amidohydrolase family protein [Streptomyces sp. NPDC020801]|uniref:amidohydrolase family protein n=1 Tax=unclassified Streptomyces TaxID=2593676 RepID=UPI0037BA0BC9